MSEPITVRVFDIVGGPLCVSTDDGQAVHDKIAPLLREGRKVSVSFARVETIISAFLNAAIGQLYGEFPEERIRELVSVTEMADSDVALLRRVVDNAKIYFANRERFDEAWKLEVGDEGDEDEE
jgi:hypothetical protein